ncbi:22294_t:CDS:2, partial [Dentiscutata erythropus]
VSGIALGAYGAHKIKNSDKLKNWEVATYYQLIHSIALVSFSNLRNPVTNKSPTLAGSLIAAGTILFSGSIYFLVWNNKSKLKARIGFITPLGGILMMAGWAALLF